MAMIPNNLGLYPDDSWMVIKASRLLFQIWKVLNVKVMVLLIV